MASGSNSLALSVPLALSPSRSATIHAEDLRFEDDPIIPVLPSSTRRWILLSLFTTANFLDVWCGSAAFVALAQMGEDLDMTLAELTWIPNSYALCLAAFLLTAGRISDIYSPKLVFVVGFSWLGILSLALPFSPNKECLLVLRALTGIGASLSIPSALALIVHLFPDPKEQSFAISIFAASGGIANLSGLILGGVILLESWHWIYWIIALISLPLAALSIFLIPSPKSLKPTTHTDDQPRLPKMDYLGTFLQTASIVLFVFGLTNSNTVGWAKVETLVPLVLGVALFPTFLYWQGKIDPIDALVSPSIFKIRNVLLLAIIMTTPGFYWTIIQVFYSNLMQDSWGYNPIGVALRFLPLGVVGGIVTLFIGHVPFKYFSLRYRLAGGAFLGSASAVLLAFAFDSSTYYSHLLPGFMFGTAGELELKRRTSLFDQQD
ncbi:major facilitator superfamily domain-containing protein [Mrakia frigida]|uniref:major facilitator superfamily domain-containing protein n=1 Tax=Mrakia frigida TaxID=29902 RepID=UPI003FCC245F